MDEKLLRLTATWRICKLALQSHDKRRPIDNDYALKGEEWIIKRDGIKALVKKHEALILSYLEELLDKAYNV